MRPGYIRPIVICIFKKDDRILVGEGYDPTKEEPLFYRPLGGRIEFGEYGNQAAVREIREELGAEVTNLRYLGTIESIFEHLGQMGHEIVLVYEGEFEDKPLYQQTIIDGLDDTELRAEGFKAMWKPIAEFHSGKARLVPDALLELLAEYPHAAGTHRV